MLTLNARSWISDILFITLLFSIGYGAFLGSYPLFVPDDARYIEVAREMARSGDFVIPRLDGFIFIEKPPLFYWFEALAIDLGGNTLWAGRSVNAIFAVLGCLLIYGFGRCFYNRQTGWYAAAILGSSALYIALSRMITIDMALTLWLTASWLCFLRAYLLMPGRPKRLWCYLAYACAGLAVLAKGLIAIVFPALVVGLWVLLRGDWKNLRYFYIPTGMLIFLAVALPWHLLAQQANAEFFDFYIIGQHFSRYATMAARRYEPAWFYFAVVAVGFIPWIIFLPAVMKQYIQQGWQAWRAQPIASFLTLWILVVFVFFSISNSKLIPYIFPIFPALALLVAHYLYTCKENKTIPWYGLYLLLGISVLFIITSWTLPFWFPEKLSPYRAMTPYLCALSVVITLFVLLAIYCWRQQWFSRGIAAVAAGMIIMGVSGITLIGPIANQKTTQPIADYLEHVLTQEDIIITYHNFYFDLPYYLDRVVLTNDDHREIRFGLQQEPHNPQWVTTEEVWKLWNSSQRVFIVTPIKFYPEFRDNETPGKLWVETSRNVLISNQ